MSKILITGGSGLAGKALTDFLLARGHEPLWLCRTKTSYKNVKCYVWDYKSKTIDHNAFSGIDGIVHLAGADISGKRWSKSYKEEILSSRKDSILFLHKVIKENFIKLKFVIGASAIGFYGFDDFSKVHKESDEPGNDFLAEVCKEWEKSYQVFIDDGVRTCIARLAVVLSNRGGAYKKMLPLFNSGLGSALGNGLQPFSWIHIHDLAALLSHLAENTEISGTYNAVSDEKVTNYEFSKTWAKKLNRPFFLPNIPGFFLRLLLGERSDIILNGVKVDNGAIKQTGFTFTYHSLNDALQNLILEKNV